MRHRAEAGFWQQYEALPASIRRLADKNFALLTENPSHPSLRFKNIKEDVWSVRVGLNHRALAFREDAAFTWFWIGTHAEYDKLLR
ncbi:MAG: hypothetical protein KGO53_00375 [Alphaproteobacteria bacterium]|nr:hypothetical protein [Alphaproteobacteria bacterium]